MAELIAACMLAWRDLTRPGIFVHALWPPLVAVIIWSLIAMQLWSPMHESIVATMPDWSWLADSFLGRWLANIALMMIFAPFIYLTVMLLTATFALPRMMEIVAKSDYPDLVRQGRGAFWGSVWNSLFAGLMYLVGWIVTLPLLLIPGVILVLPLMWTAWLNQRTFRYDSLAEHANPSERYQIIRDAKGSLYAAGGVSALLAHVPIVNLIAPAWTALLYVHLCLLRLRRLRSEGAVWEQGSQ